MKGSRMFPFITRTWNPLGGACLHGCSYCWARKLAERYMFKKYAGEPRIFTKEMNRNFTDDDFVFVCDMCDLFGDWVPDDIIRTLVFFTDMHAPTQFLFLTKNPKRYKDFTFGDNCVLGATIETDFDWVCQQNAPSRSERIVAMASLTHKRKMVSVEPIMKFSPEFIRELLRIQPEFVAVGYDNYHNNLPEPRLGTTQALISTLQTFGIKVYEKTLREPHH